MNKATLANGTASVVTFLAADAHLILKSAADGVVKAEAYLVNKLTGEAKTAIIEDRHNKTAETQENLIKGCELIKERIAKLVSTKSIIKDDAFQAAQSPE